MNDETYVSDPFPELTLDQAKERLNRLYGRISRLEKAVRIAAASSPMGQAEISQLLSLANYP